MALTLAAASEAAVPPGAPPPGDPPRAVRHFPCEAVSAVLTASAEVSAASTTAGTAGTAFEEEGGGSGAPQAQKAREAAPASRHVSGVSLRMDLRSTQVRKSRRSEDRRPRDD
jgi:hypothetical protein